MYLISSHFISFDKFSTLFDILYVFMLTTRGHWGYSKVVPSHVAGTKRFGTVLAVGASVSRTGKREDVGEKKEGDCLLQLMRGPD